MRYSDTKVRRLATELWAAAQKEPMQGWIDYNHVMKVRKPSNREVMGEIVGTYYKPPLDLVIGDIQEADRIMNGGQ